MNKNERKIKKIWSINQSVGEEYRKDINSLIIHSLSCLSFSESNKSEVKLIRISIHKFLSDNARICQERFFRGCTMINRSCLSSIKFIQPSILMNERNKMRVDFILLAALSTLHCLLVIRLQFIATKEMRASLFSGHCRRRISKVIHNRTSWHQLRFKVQHRVHYCNCSASISSVLLHEIHAWIDFLNDLLFLEIVRTRVFANRVQEHDSFTRLWNHFLRPFFDGKQVAPWVLIHIES